MDDSGAKAIRQPTRHTNGANRSSIFETTAVGKGIIQELNDFSRREKIATSELFQLAWVLALRKPDSYEIEYSHSTFTGGANTSIFSTPRFETRRVGLDADSTVVEAIQNIRKTATTERSTGSIQNLLYIQGDLAITAGLPFLLINDRTEGSGKVCRPGYIMVGLEKFADKGIAV